MSDKTISKNWGTYHIEFVMAPNLYKANEEAVGLGFAVEDICYRGADFNPLYNFRDADGVVKVRARSESFPTWKAETQYIATKRDLLEWLYMDGWILEDYQLVKEKESWLERCTRKGLPVPDCCKTYSYDDFDEDDKSKGEYAYKLRPWGFSAETLIRIENFCKEKEVSETEIEEAAWPAKEMITDTYKIYPKFT
jgi:hypothetical protein